MNRILSIMHRKANFSTIGLMKSGYRNMSRYMVILAKTTERAVKFDVSHLWKNTGSGSYTK